MDPKRSVSGLALLLVLNAAPLAPTARADDDGTWFQLTELARHSSVLVHDAGRDRLIVCSGRNGDAFYNDIRALDLSGDGGWSRLDVPTTRLPLMVSPIVAYDPTTDRLIFVYDVDTSPKVGAVSLLGEPVWTPITPTGMPIPPRGSVASAYDPDANRVVFFGGEEPSTSTYFNDVWSLDLGPSPAWRQHAPDGTAPTPRRSLMVYDTFRHAFVVLGQYGKQLDPFEPPGPLTDAWRLSLGAHDSDWVPIATTGAFPVDLGTSVYDAGHDRVVVLGLVDQGGSHALSLGAAPAWTSLPGLPATLLGFGACLDATRQQVFTFGGAGSMTFSVLEPDVWQFDLATAQWSLHLSGPNSPRRRKSGPAVYDPVRDHILTFSPTSSGAPLEVRRASMATGEWEDVIPAAGPRPGAPGRLVGWYRAATDRVMIYGEFTQSGVTDEELWSFSYDARAWTRITLSTPSHPPPNQAIAYDPYRDRLMGYFGGYGTWVLPLFGSVGWVQLSNADGSPPPQNLPIQAGVYDPAQDRYVFTARSGDQEPPFSGTWVLWLASARWDRLYTVGPVSEAASPSVYDPLYRRVLAANGASIYALGYDYPDARWTLLDPDGAPPESRQSSGVTYDMRRGGLILVGGWQPGHLPFPIDDLWRLTPDEAVELGILPGADVVWNPGGVTPVNYVIRNPYAFDVDVPYRVTSERNWPGYPLLGNVMVAGRSSLTLVVDAPVPDTAAGPANTLSMSAIFQQTGFRDEDRRRLVDATTPTLLAVTSVETEPGLVRLYWFGAGVEGEPVVERRESGSAWRPLGAPSVPSPGSYAFEDRDVSPGREYVYRLIVSGAGATFTSDESRVVVPARREPGLWLASGNPTRRLRVGFALPDAGPARLEVFDISGRRQLSRDVSAAGAGEREEFLDAPGLAPGVYVIRLTRGARAYTARAVLVR